MKKKVKSKSKIVETTNPKKPETDKNGLKTEQELNMKITVITYMEPTRPYFSSPCMLSEMEDDEDFLNR
ncbi:MAG: hypothetical protein Q8N05_09895 [Bacteroidota bacterium]|nr:hypothetical protein [Bacteroidota bacterium]